MRPSRILFIRKEGLFAEPIECEPGSLGLSKFAGRALEPSHGARGRSGVPLAFCVTLTHPFRLEGGVVCRAHRVGAWVAGSQQVCREIPRASARSERAIRSSPGFLCDPRASFSFGRRCLFAETPSRASLGRWVSARFAGRAPEPPHGARGRSGVPLAFYATLAHPFRSEGGVEYARLPLVGANGDTSGELLLGKSEWRPVPHSIRVG